MNTERIIRTFAGTMVLVSVFLALIYTKWWLALTMFVGANLFQSGITKWCLMEDILKKFGMKSCLDDQNKEKKDANV
jgi:hypothetical protein